MLIDTKCLYIHVYIRRIDVAGISRLRHDSFHSVSITQQRMSSLRHSPGDNSKPTQLASLFVISTPLLRMGRCEAGDVTSYLYSPLSLSRLMGIVAGNVITSFLSPSWRSGHVYSAWPRYEMSLHLLGRYNFSNIVFVMYKGLRIVM